MRLLLLGVALAVVAASPLIGAPKKEVMVPLLKCDLTLDQSKDIGFWLGDAEKNHKSTDIIVQQAASPVGLPINPRFDIMIRALDKDKKHLVRPGGAGIKHLKRVLLHPLEEGLAVAYARDESSVKSFLITTSELGSFINFQRDVQEGGTVVQVPGEIDCEMIHPVNILDAEEAVDVKGLKNEQLVTVIDSYLGMRLHDPDYMESAKKLGLTKAEYAKLQAEIGEYIVKTPLKPSHKYEGKCEKQSVRKLLTAKDHTGQVLGFRLKVICQDYQRTEVRVNASKTMEITTPFKQAATVYFNAKLDKLAESRYEEKGYPKYKKIGEPPSDE